MSNFMPLIDQPLVDYLSHLYPDRCPSLKDSDRDIWFKAGQRSVVDHLLYILREQEGSQLLKDHT